MMNYVLKALIQLAKAAKHPAGHMLIHNITEWWSHRAQHSQKSTTESTQ